VAVCLCCVKNRLSHNFKPQHVVPICIVLVTRPFQPFVFYQRQNSQDIYFASWGKIDSIFLAWITWKFSECWQESELMFKIFRSRSRSLKAWSRSGGAEKLWSRSGVGVWKVWLRSSLLLILYDSPLSAASAAALNEHRRFLFLYSFKSMAVIYV